MTRINMSNDATAGVTALSNFNWSHNLIKIRSLDRHLRI